MYWLICVSYKHISSFFRSTKPEPYFIFVYYGFASWFCLPNKERWGWNENISCLLGEGCQIHKTPPYLFGIGGVGK